MKILARSGELLNGLIGVDGPGLRLFVLNVTMYLISFLMVIARLCTRKHYRQMGADDYIMMAAMLPALIFTIVNCMSVDLGFGRKQDTLSHENVTQALMLFFVDQLTYKLAINLIKASYLLLYHRLFPSPKFRKVIHGVLILVILNSIATISATCAECTPLSKIWDRSVSGHCFDIAKFWKAGAWINMWINIIIMFLPFWPLWNVQVPLAKKIGIGLVFLLGFIGVLISILRLTTLGGGNAVDITSGSLKPTSWTSGELNCFIVVACLTVLKAPLQAGWKRLRTPKRQTTEDSTPLASTNMDVGLEEWLRRNVPSTEPSTNEP